MLNIKEIEESVMIEVNDWNYPLSNLIADVTVLGDGLSREEINKYASNIAASLYVEGYITFQKAVYQNNQDDSYEFVSARDLTDEEIDYILIKSEAWDDNEILSFENVYEFVITEKGKTFFGN